MMHVAPAISTGELRYATLRRPCVRLQARLRRDRVTFYPGMTRLPGGSGPKLIGVAFHADGAG